jgi:hypothetical protein
MKFNPTIKKLYTDENKLIKKMHCPYPSLKWGDLSSIDGSMSRFCSICESNVIDTKEYSDTALLQLLQEEPSTCLKIDFNQENLRIVHHV